MPESGVLVFNGGSSSLKFTLFEMSDGALVKKCVTGQIERITRGPHLQLYSPQRVLLAEHRWPEDASPSETEMLTVLIDLLDRHMHLPLLAAGHRIVHGGLFHGEPAFVDESVLTHLEATVPLAPLHLPHNIAPIRALAQLYPQLPQIGCFDTGFHATIPRVARLFGLPRKLAGEGVVRYGFHGLSYAYIASQLPYIDARAAAGRTLVAHLGNGASVCALVNGRSVATSMGFSALDGLIMGTRCGELDPGVLIYLLRERDYDAQTLEQLLYHESGLLGLSGGIGSDMRDLLASDAAAAREAIDVFVYRLVREIGSMVAAMQGIDALVFTGGIGEHAAPIREAVCSQLRWLGIELSTDANNQNGQRMHSATSSVSIWCIPTDEELVIAKECQRLLRHAQ
ncbi:MAG TPA: acetate/propionate family kinase [Spongiibacteraceae bacterium]|nr:acetate/propionate family kinase [Spongiibacteraceae bacterium]